MKEKGRQPVRVMVVDDSAVVRSGIAALLRAAQDMRLVGEANSGAQAVRVCAQVKPDVVLVDVGLPDMDGDHAIRALGLVCPTARVIALTSFGEAEYLSRALGAGAVTSLVKNVSAAELAKAIRAAYAREQKVRAVTGSDGTLAASSPVGSDRDGRER